MIQEQYVSFEIAKLLKEKGFDELCLCIYDTECTNHISVLDYEVTNNELEYRDNMCYLAPTQALVMRWLREVYNLFIQVCIVSHTTVTMEQKYYFFTIHKDRRKIAFKKDYPYEYYATYEEACEAAIKYCLENLI